MHMQLTFEESLLRLRRYWPDTDTPCTKKIIRKSFWFIVWTEAILYVVVSADGCIVMTSPVRQTRVLYKIMIKWWDLDLEMAQFRRWEVGCKLEGVSSLGLDVDRHEASSRLT